MTLILLILPEPESAVQTAIDMIRYPGSKMCQDEVVEGGERVKRVAQLYWFWRRVQWVGSGAH